MADEGCIDTIIPGKCIPRGVEALIRELAERQHGVVARRQLIAAGISKHAVDLRVERRSLCLVHSGVYAVGHLQLGFLGRLLAAVLACGPGAAISHRSAGRLWNLIGYSGSAAMEVTRPRRFRPRPGIVAHRSDLPEDEVEEVEGIPVTSVSRTIFDLAAVVSRRRLEGAMNEADVRGLTSRLSLHDLLERHPRRRGSASLRSLLREGAVADGVTRSELEELFVGLIDKHGLRRPRLNAALRRRRLASHTPHLAPAQRRTGIDRLRAARAHAGGHRCSYPVDDESRAPGVLPA